MSFEFNTIIKPARLGAALHFPNDKCIGLAMVYKDKAKKLYSMRFWFSEAVAKKANLHMQGQFVFAISNCSNALQITFNPKPEPEFKGFKLIPSGTSKNKEETKKLGTTPYPCSATAALSKEALNFTKSALFDRQFLKVISIEKNKIIIDISGVPIYLDTNESKKKPKPKVLPKTTL